MRKITAAVLFFSLLVSILIPAGADFAEAGEMPEKPPKGFFEEEESAPAFRRDMFGYGDVTVPGNLRLLTGEPGENYKFRKMSTKYGYPEEYEANMTGMDTLNISGSSQYSVGQFRYLAQKIIELAPEVQNVYIIDLRQESHGFVSDESDPDYQGIPLSWHGRHNWANFGMSIEEVLAAEKKLFSESVGTGITLQGRHRKGEDGHPAEIRITESLTEADLVRTINDEIPGVEFHYLRFAIPDRTFPEAEIVDAFVEFVRGIDMERSWLHFHCLAGMGRTAIMMSLYDMMKNPGVPMADILARQTMTGGSYPLSPSHDEEYLASHDAERIRLVPLVYEYIQENRGSNYEISWSEWLEEKDADAA